MEILKNITPITVTANALTPPPHPPKFFADVPYDHNLPMIFQGEEISLGVRGFTHGYDYYTPERSVCFHYYASKKDTKRKKVPMFWQHSNAHSGAAVESLKRLTKVIRIDPQADYDLKAMEGDKDLGEYGRFGLGRVRDPETFYDMVGIDVERRRSAKGLCKSVTRGGFHQKLKQYLREDGGGIDYDDEGLKGWRVPTLRWED